MKALGLAGVVLFMLGLVACQPQGEQQQQPAEQQQGAGEQAPLQEGATQQAQ